VSVYIFSLSFVDLIKRLSRGTVAQTTNPPQKNLASRKDDRFQVHQDSKIGVEVRMKEILASVLRCGHVSLSLPVLG
jgi:hypothetical protein